MLPPPMPNRTCEGCGDPLAPDKRKDARFCTAGCQQKSWHVARPEKERQRGQRRYWSNLEKERARSREKIDPTLSHPGPMCATVDHVVPLSRGGTDLRSNVAPAHLRCNLVKKDRPASELRQIGRAPLNS